MSEKTDKIITFYSYKGGTGRSMTLANVAWILACAGKKVLTIDWDLEAPGLHRYFYPFLIDKELTASDGIIDFVINYALEAVSPGHERDPEWYKPHANILRYALSLEYEFPKPGRLDFVPAGRQGLSYATRVNSFDWQTFYDRLGGGLFLEEAKRQMREEYDFILVDSRTGVSDTSGICTIQMPDILVTCFTLNNQGIDGTAAVANSVFEQLKSTAQSSLFRTVPKEEGLEDPRLEELARQRRADLEERVSQFEERRSRFNIFPVPMRLETGEKDKLDERMARARAAFSQFPVYIQSERQSQYWTDVGVFYVPFYAYEEILAAFGDREESVAKILNSAERLTFYLTGGKVSKLLQPPSDDERNRVRANYAGKTVKVDPIEEHNRIAENAFARLSPEQQIASQSVILRLLRVAGENDLSGDARQRIDVSEFGESAKQILLILREGRLLSIDADQKVQIAEDGFLKGWKRLQEWLAKERNFLSWRERFRPQVTEWKLNGKNNGSLLQDDELSVAELQLRDRHDNLTSDEREYIQQSIRFRDLAREREQRERERRRWSEESDSGIASINIRSARNVLRGERMELRDILRLAKKLKQEKQFGLARRLLARARLEPSLNLDSELRRQVYQQSALCTYKDPGLPAYARLDRALDILRQSAEDLGTTTDQETLGLSGAIYKRKWELDNQVQQLERALNYYLRGYAQGPINDQGYTGINAAFILDLLAYQEEEEVMKSKGVISNVAVQRRKQANEIRAEIVEQVEPLIDQRWLQGQWWFYATIAEAHFGTGNYETAINWLLRGREDAADRYTLPAWEYESTARQLAALARLQKVREKTDGSLDTSEIERALTALRRFFGHHEVLSAYVGKIGLALSGGGFRAALFHIGVLARLAELDVLRRVEVLSCVSGGSIIGAHYYLEVRKLLQSKTDDDISKQDYIDIVVKVRKDFLDGVQRNIRTRVAVNPFQTIKMIFTSKYSRTMRAGDLYESEIFSRVEDGGGSADRMLNGLFVCPLRPDGLSDVDFNLTTDNWRRRAKVPSLILNTTALNSGHNWQFTSSWMGEPAAGIDDEIDGNDRLRRLYYDGEDTPKPYRKVRLGHAVAASACVPGVFESLPLDKLYPERIVRLVDGGVCDNQGTASLLDQDCNVILVSDGSGQMGSENQPSNGLLGVPLRANSILQARVREAQYRELSARKRAGLLRGFMFVHLKDDLSVDPIDWIGCLDPYDASDDSRPAYRRGPLTRYGIAKDMQELLAGVRTDLDSFSDVEAFALMTSAYRMTEHEFRYSKCVEGFPEPKEQYNWDFLAIEEGMKGSGAKYDYLKKQLSVGNTIAFKIWKLSTPLKITAWMLAAAAIAFALWACFHWASKIVVHLTLWDIGIFIASTVAFALLAYVIINKLMGIMRFRETLIRIAIALAITVLGWFAAGIHLLFFDPLFLRGGSLKTFKKVS